VRNLGHLLIGKRARIQGFGVPYFADRYPEARTWLAAQAKLGRLRHHVHVIVGFERAPGELGTLPGSENNGKLVVRVAEWLFRYVSATIRGCLMTSSIAVPRICASGGLQRPIVI
jgi:hypothetical protein